MKKHRKPTHVRDAIISFLKAAGLKDRFEENLAIAFWDASVGKDVAQHTSPKKVVQGTMFVKVDEDVWRHELAFYKHQIIQDINEKVGKKAITEIKFY